MTIGQNPAPAVGCACNPHLGRRRAGGRGGDATMTACRTLALSMGGTRNAHPVGAAPGAGVEVPR